MDYVLQLKSRVRAILKAPWDTRRGFKVPSTDSIKLTGGGVKLKATFLYADLAQSSALVSEHDTRLAAKTIKSFLSCSTRLIRKCGGKVVSFDGDRVMGVFVGKGSSSLAANCGLHINYTHSEVITPILTQYSSKLLKGNFEFSHCVGVDCGEVLAVRTGIRGSNDIVWIGDSPNFAAKLSDIRNPLYKTYISSRIFDEIAESSKYVGEPLTLMWKEQKLKWLGTDETVYGSSWQWKP